MKMKILGTSAALLLTFGVVSSFAQDDSSAPSPKRIRGFGSILSTIAHSANAQMAELGIVAVEISKNNFTSYNLSEVRGVGVQRVVENSPAEKSGFMEGDVIVRYNGEEVTSVSKLVRLIRETAPDHQVKITVLRHSTEIDLTAEMGGQQKVRLTSDMVSAYKSESPFQPGVEIYQGQILPENGGAPSGFVMERSYYLGVNVMPLSSQLAKHLGVTEGKGLLISEVSENSPAAKSGLKAGDVIVSVDEQKTVANIDLIKAVNTKKDAPLSVTFIRDKRRQTIKIKAEPYTADTQNKNVVRQSVERRPTQ